MPAGVDTHAGTGSAESGRDPRAAAQAATLAARAHLSLSAPRASREPIELALVFAAGQCAVDPSSVLEAVGKLGEAHSIVGCSATTVFTEAGSLDNGVAVMLLQGAFPIVATAAALERDPAGAARSLGRQLHRKGEGPGAVLLLLDPRSLRGPTFPDALRDALPPGTPIFGGGAGLVQGRAWVAGGALRPGAPLAQPDAVVAIGLPELALRAELAPAHHPVTPIWTVTAASGSRLLRLNDAPALRRLRAALPECTDIRSLLAGLPMGGPGGTPLARLQGIAALEPETDSICLDQAVQVGQLIAFYAEDTRQTAAALRAAAAHAANPDARFAILVDGPRGAGPGPVTAALPELPLIGWRGPRLIAPIEARPAELLGGSALLVASDP